MTKHCLESCPQIQMGKSIACENPVLSDTIEKSNQEYVSNCPGQLKIEVVDPTSLGKNVLDVICRSPKLMQSDEYRREVSWRIRDAYRKVN